MKKQPFTIEGSVPLKKALLEETGLSLDIDTLLEYRLLRPSCTGLHRLEGCYSCEFTHYQLPKQWDEAVQAVKDFFAEEKFEKGKWYYAEYDGTNYLIRYQETRPIYGIKDKFHYNDIAYTEFIKTTPNRPVVYLTNNYISSTELEQALQPATKEQIQEMLGEVAKQKGYMKGVKINSLVPSNNIVSLCNDRVAYDDRQDVVWVGNCKVYQKGKWATVIALEEDPKPETPEKLVLKGVQFGNGVNMLGAIADLHLTADHLEQLKAYFNK